MAPKPLPKINVGKKPAPKTWQELLTDPDERNAYAALEEKFRQYGLESLAGKILEYVKNGDGEATIALKLQDTQEWKARFAGNEILRKNKQPVLSVDQYLATEKAMRAHLTAYGVPKNYYDQNEDFAGLIGAGLSADEVGGRAKAAWDFTQKTNPQNRKMLKEYYGVDESMIAAYFLDPKKGQALIDKQVQAAGYGGIGARQNLTVDKGIAESWVDQGFDTGRVQQGVEQAASIAGDVGRIAKRYGDSYTQTDALNETVGGLASARRKRERVSRKENAQFGGSAGAATFGGADTGGF